MVRGYAAALKIRLSLLPASPECDQLIGQFRLAQALNQCWTRNRTLSCVVWNSATLSWLAQRVLAVLYPEFLSCAELLEEFWPTSSGDASALLCTLSDLADLDAVLQEVYDFCAQPLEAQAAFLAEWGVSDGARSLAEVGNPLDPAQESPLPLALSRRDARSTRSEDDSCVVSRVPGGSVSSPPRVVAGKVEKLSHGNSALSEDDSSYQLRSAFPPSPPPPPSYPIQPPPSPSTHSASLTEGQIADLVAAEVSKRLSASLTMSPSGLDQDAIDLQQAPDKVRQGLQLLQPVGDHTPRDKGVKPLLVRDVPVFLHKKGDLSDATGSIIKHLNVYDLQATRANASYAERARDLDMGAFLSESAKELHVAMKKTLPVYQHTFLQREGETTQQWEKRMYMRAIRLMLASFHAHKPEFRLLQEIAAVSLPTPTSSDFIIFTTKIFQLYTQLGVDQRTRGQYFNAVLGGLMRCTTEAFKHDGAYWAGRFRDRYTTQTELVRTDISRRIATGALPDTASGHAIPIVLDEQTTNAVVDTIRDEMEQNEHAQATWG